MLLSLLLGLLARAAAQNTPVGRASNVEVAGSKDEPQAIELRASLRIPDGDFVQLPIRVDPPAVVIDGDGSPKITKLWAEPRTAVLNAGQELSVYVEFTSPVVVVGDSSALALVLASGCNDDGCAVKEEQSFTCKADLGSFAITLYDDLVNDAGVVRNIDVRSDQEQLKYYLETIKGVENVTIYYGYEDDREYSGGRRACTTNGNEIIVTFERATYADQFDGDVPAMRLDALNAAVDPLTMLPLSDGTHLDGRLVGSTVKIDAVAKEHVKGVRGQDGRAKYADGSGTNVLRFDYVVKRSDASPRLEAVKFVDSRTDVALESISTTVFISSLFAPYATADPALPPQKGSARYSSGRGQALGSSSFIVLDSTEPSVLNVTSPSPDGEYGAGAEIFVDVRFDKPVKAFAGSDSDLLLAVETGEIDRYATFIGVIGGDFVVRFLYTVNVGDAADDLDYQTADSVIVQGGGYIRRWSTNIDDSPDANVILPEPSKKGSLAFSSALVIDTDVPRVTQVSFFSFNGGNLTAGKVEAAAGDVVDIKVTFSKKVAVEGLPRLLLSTGRVERFPALVEAPVGGSVVAAAARPASALQTRLRFALSCAIEAGDVVTFQLPRKAPDFRHGHVPNATLIGEDGDRWSASIENSTITFTAVSNVPAAYVNEIVIAANNALIAPRSGLQSKGIEGGVAFTLSASLLAVNVDESRQALFATQISSVDSISLSKTLLTYGKVRAGDPVHLQFGFTTRADLHFNESLALRLPPFALSANYTLPISESHVNITNISRTALRRALEEPFGWQNASYRYLPLVSEAQFEALWTEGTKTLELRTTAFLLPPGSYAIKLRRGDLVVPSRGLSPDDDRLRVGTPWFEQEHAAGAFGEFEDAVVSSAALGAFSQTSLRFFQKDGTFAAAGYEAFVELAFRLGPGTVKLRETFTLRLFGFTGTLLKLPTDSADWTLTWDVDSGLVTFEATRDGAGSEYDVVKFSGVHVRTKGVFRNWSELKLASAALAAPVRATEIFDSNAVGAFVQVLLRADPNEAPMLGGVSSAFSLVFRDQLGPPRLAEIEVNASFAFAFPFFQVSSNVTTNGTSLECSLVPGWNVTLTDFGTAEATFRLRAYEAFPTGVEIAVDIPAECLFAYPARGVSKLDVSKTWRFSSFYLPMLSGPRPVDPFCVGFCEPTLVLGGSLLGNTSVSLTFASTASVRLVVGDVVLIRVPVLWVVQVDAVLAVTSAHFAEDAVIINGDTVRLRIEKDLAPGLTLTALISRDFNGLRIPVSGFTASDLASNCTLSTNATHLIRHGAFTDPMPFDSVSPSEMNQVAFGTRLRTASINFSTSAFHFGEPRRPGIKMPMTPFQLRFEVNRQLEPMETLSLTLPGFVRQDDKVLPNVALQDPNRYGDGVSNHTWAALSFHDGTKVLTLQHSCDFAQTAEVVLNITGLRPPETGVKAGNAHGIMLETDTDFGSLAFQSVFVGAPLVTATLPAVAYYDDAGSFGNSNRDSGRPGERAGLLMTVALGGLEKLFLGDVLTWHLPGFDVEPHAPLNVTVGPPGTAGDDCNATALWAPREEVLVLSVGKDYAFSGSLAFFVGDAAVPGGALLLPKAGVYADPQNLANTTLTLESRHYATVEAFSALKCAGVCTAQLTFGTYRAGSATALTFSLTTSFAPVQGMQFKLLLNKGRVSACGDVADSGDCFRRLGVGGGRGSPLLVVGLDADKVGDAFWDRNTSAIVVTTRAFSTSRSFQITVQFSSYIALPTSGIPSNQRSVGVAFNGSEVGTLQPTFEFVQFRGVGLFPEMDASFGALPSCTYSRRASGEHAELAARFSYSLGLTGGDAVRLHLADFTRDASTLKVTLTDLVNDLVIETTAVWDAAAEALRVTLAQGAAVQALDVMSLHVSGLLLPTTTLVKDDHRLRVSVEAVRGDAASQVFRTSPAVGRLSETFLEWDPPVMVASGFGGGFLAGFTPACDVQAGDVFAFYLPGLKSGNTSSFTAVEVPLYADAHVDTVFTFDSSTGVTTSVVHLRTPWPLAGFATWDRQRETLTLRAQNSSKHLFPEGQVRFYVGREARFSASRVKLVSAKTYELSTNTTECPSDFVKIERQPVVGVESAKVAGFSPKITGAATAVSLEFKAAGALVVGDAVFFDLGGFDATLPSGALTVETSSHALLAYATPAGTGGYVRGRVVIQANAAVARGALVTAKISGMRLPSRGVDAGQVSVSINASLAGYASPAFVDSVPIVGALLNSTFAFLPRVAGGFAFATLNVTLSCLTPKQVVLLTLPGFVTTSTMKVLSEAFNIATVAWARGSTSVRFTTVATPEANADGTFSLWATFPVAQLPAAGVDGANPANGITLELVTLGGCPLSKVALAKVDTSIALLVSEVIWGSSDFGYASLQGGDSLQVRFPASEQGLADWLPQGAAAAGVQYRVGGALLTVKRVDGDVVTLASPDGYDVARVSARKYDGFGLPRSDGLVSVETPGRRPAWYERHDGFDVFFRYNVRPFDFAAALDYTHVSALGCPEAALADAVGVAGDECWIRRDSPTPTVDADFDLEVPGSFGSIAFFKKVEIDTSSPRILNVSTSAHEACTFPQSFSPETVHRSRFVTKCVFALGHRIDVTVAFDAPVAVDDSFTLHKMNVSSAEYDFLRNTEAFRAPPETAASVLLHVDSIGRQDRFAMYLSGSKTQTLDFVYEIQIGDLALQGLDYVARDDPVQGQVALRAGFGAVPGYIRREALEPTTDLNFSSLPQPGSAGSLYVGGGFRVIIDADAPRVVSVSAWENGTFSAGDVVTILVAFSGPVDPRNDAGRPCGGHELTLWLDVANPRLDRFADEYPHQARYVGKAKGSSNSTLRFEYTVQKGDVADRLEYACAPCDDFLVTPALWVNASCDVHAVETGRLASPILPRIYGPGSLHNTSAVRLDSDPPRVESVTADFYDVASTPRTAGDVVSIYVLFDLPVVVGGDANFVQTSTSTPPKIDLAAGNGRGAPFPFEGRNCVADYVAGSGSSELRFEFTVRPPMGTACLDYAGAGALRGTVLRYSKVPQIDADSRLQMRGTPQSLGGYVGSLKKSGTSFLMIDTSRPHLETANVDGSLLAVVAAAARQTLDVEILKRSEDGVSRPFFTRGSFSLRFGEKGPATRCVNLATLNASEIENALEKVYPATVPRVLEARVDATVGLLYIRRFIVELARASLTAGLVVEECEVFQCGNANNRTRAPAYAAKEERYGAAADGCAAVTANRDGFVEEGLAASSLEVDVNYDNRYTLAATGALVLGLGNVGGFEPRSLRRVEASNVQVIEVGVSAASQLLGGDYQLRYGGRRTGCIEAGGISFGSRSLRFRLLEIPAIAAMGIEAVSRESFAHGFRYTVKFASNMQPLPLEAVQHSRGACRPLMPADGTVRVFPNGRLASVRLREDFSAGARAVFTLTEAVAANETLKFQLDLVAPPCGPASVVGDHGPGVVGTEAR
ncbi:hypothetical protein M885DRAFT_268034 [Pelagophyceae sp. CCMP2097]|nr:hypothetical protein M885DRAFT_268034 [Pelagophyceae sp. CCMP2097]